MYERLKDVPRRICPHMAVSDPLVLSRFWKSCTRTFDMIGPDCPCWICCQRPFSSNDGQWRGCRTKVLFRQHRNANGTITLYLLVGQCINTMVLGAVNDESWKQYLSLKSELRGLAQEWLDYSICCIRDPELKEQILPASNNPFLNLQLISWW